MIESSRVRVRLSKNVLDSIDRRRGMVSRAGFIEASIRFALENADRADLHEIWLMMKSGVYDGDDKDER
jgi:metal-responsive CopG/Arc/MetJ family transcriptional regulator